MPGPGGPHGGPGRGPGGGPRGGPGGGMGRPPMGRPPRPPRPPGPGWGPRPYRRGGCMGCLCTFLLGAGSLIALLVALFSLIL